MKTLRKRSFLILMGTIGLLSVRAQTADEIVNKHIDAVGGKTVVAGVKSLYVESTIEVMGTEAPSVTSIIAGKGFKSETDFNGAKIIQVVTDKSGWAINPMAGQSSATAMTDEQVKASQAQLNPGGPLLDYASKGFKIELIGKDTADYKVKLNGPSYEVTYFINMKTYQIDKEISKVSAQGQDVEVTTTFGDYKKTETGFVMPYTRAIVLPQYSLNITTKKVEVNKTIDPAIFDMPK